MMYKFTRLFYSWFTHFLAPPYCLFCRQDILERKALCYSCHGMILPIVPFDFYIGLKRTIRIFSVSAYLDPIKSLVLSKQSRNETHIKFLADLMSEHLILDHLDFDIITFIPLHWSRYASRGFNQSEIIAKAIEAKTGKFMIPLVVRSKKTEFQARLSVQERDNNVKDAFVINQSYSHFIAGKKILIVDDLFTTGSTVRAVAKVLLPYNPERIDCFVACRVT